MKRTLATIFLALLTSKAVAQDVPQSYVHITTRVSIKQDLSLFKYAREYYLSKGLSEFDASQLTGFRVEQGMHDQLDGALQQLRNEVGEAEFNRILSNFGVKFE